VEIEAVEIEAVEIEAVEIEAVEIEARVGPGHRERDDIQSVTSRSSTDLELSSCRLHSISRSLPFIRHTPS
jgi:hypothetical protein